MPTHRGQSGLFRDALCDAGKRPPVELPTTISAAMFVRSRCRATSGAQTREATSSSGSAGSIHQRAPTCAAPYPLIGQADGIEVAVVDVLARRRRGDIDDAWFMSSRSVLGSRTISDGVKQSATRSRSASTPNSFSRAWLRSTTSSESMSRS